MERPMMTYLERRGAMYRFRRVVPDDLRAFFLTSSGNPRAEFSVSLGTKDRREAERLCRIKSVEIDAMLDDARNRLARGASGAPLPSPRPMTAMPEGELAEMELRSAANLEADFEREAREGKGRGWLNMMAAEPSEGVQALRDLVDDNLFAPELEQRLRQQAIDRSWSEGEAAVGRQNGLGGSVQVATTYPALMALFDSYVAEAGPQPATVKRWRPVIAHLVAHLGHDDASKLTTADVRRWRQALSAEKNGAGQVRAPRTIRETYLAALKAVLNNSVENGRLPENVAKPVTLRVPRAVRLRDPEFTDQEASLILRAALAETSAKLAPEHALARRWVPWICAYSGARVNEVTQLRAEDVRRVQGIWTMRITPEAGSVKNKAARVVPLHSHLVEQGFPAVAEGKKAGHLFFDPARGRSGSDGNPQHKKTGERLAKWVRSIGVDDPNVQPNHAWRHLFITRARAAGMDAEARDAIPGHASATEGRKYGTKPVVFLSAELEKLPRFDLHPAA